MKVFLYVRWLPKMLALVLFGIIMSDFLGVNFSPSIPIGIYLHAPGPIKSGDVVSFYSEELDKQLVKYVAATPGEEVCIKDGVYRAGGTVLGKIVEGHEAYLYCGVVPHNEVFVVGIHNLSFDSRYFGPISYSTLTRYTPFILF